MAFISLVIYIHLNMQKIHYKIYSNCLLQHLFVINNCSTLKGKKKCIDPCSIRVINPLYHANQATKPWG